MSSPDPRYFKDGTGLRVRHWSYLRSFGVRKWFWKAQPRWLLTWRCRWRDRHCICPSHASNRGECRIHDEKGRVKK